MGPMGQSHKIKNDLLVTKVPKVNRPAHVERQPIDTLLATGAPFGIAGVQLPSSIKPWRMRASI